ncbi:MAG: PepSY domain-containing protein [Anaerolineales bacterium]
MSQRIALFLSVALTAFVLVFIGAAISIRQWGQAATASPTLDPQLLAQLQEREATYQAMIDQANAQLQATDPAASATSTLAPEPTATQYPVSPDLAIYLAQSAAPNSYLVRLPELVSFQGAVAYEVTFNTGKIYIDANSGQILYNGAGFSSAAGSDSSAGREQDGGDD